MYPRVTSKAETKEKVNGEEEKPCSHKAGDDGNRICSAQGKQRLEYKEVVNQRPINMRAELNKDNDKRTHFKGNEKMLNFHQ